MLGRISDWASYLKTQGSEQHLDEIRKHARTGRPIGNGDFLKRLEQLTGRRLEKGKPGRKTNE
jgi:putative transposase